MSALTALSFLVIAIWPIATAGEQAPHPSLKACELLSRVELETAVGGTVSHPTGAEKAYTKNPFVDHDGVLYTCSETVGARKVTLRLNTSPTSAEGRKFAQTGAKGAEDALRAQGFQVQTKDVGGSRCMTVLPPPGSNQGADADMLGTNCVRENGPYVVSITVGALGSSDALPIEKVAALAERAASRMPAQ